MSTMYDLKNALYLSFNVFSSKVLIGDTIFQDISYWRQDHHFMCYLSHAKVWPFAGQR